MVWDNGGGPLDAVNVRLLMSTVRVVPVWISEKLVESVGLDWTVIVAVRVALARLGARVTPAVPVVLGELVDCRVNHGAVVVMNEGQELEAPAPLLQEMVVDPPVAGKLVPLLEVMVKRLLVHVLWAHNGALPAQPSNTTVAARHENNDLVLNTTEERWLS
jgi:hypothetical protein